MRYIKERKYTCTLTMKIISLLLTLILLIGSFSACGDGSEPSSADKSEALTSSEKAESGESSAPSHESSEPDEESSDSVGPIVIEHRTIISAGKSYTTSKEAGDAYPDTYRSELTDGVYAETDDASYTNSKFSGFSENINIIVDLGEVYDMIYGFEISYLAANSAGIAPPSGTVFYVSENGTDYTRAGYGKNEKFEEGTTKKAKLTLESFVKARYVKFTVNRASAWVFIDEVSVIANLPDSDMEAKYLTVISDIYKNDKTDYASVLSGFNGSATDFSKTRTNLAAGQSYIVSGTVSEKFKNTDSKLTNGIIWGYYESDGWVGFEGGEASVTVTLPSVRKDISSFELYYFCNPSLNIWFPACVTVSVSDDGKSYTDVGRIYGPSDTTATTYAYKLVLPSMVSARFVRFTVKGDPKSTMLLEEICVYAHDGKINTTGMYPVVSLPEVTGREYFTASDSDYTKLQSLISGLSQQIITAIEPSSAVWENNTPVTSILMTDGKYSNSNNIHNGSFFKFNQGSHRDVIYDIGKLASVGEFTASFVNMTDWNVTLPGAVNVSVSDDAKTWYTAGAMRFDTSKNGQTQKVSLKLKKNVEARFVMFSFDVGTWAGCDELEVIGTKKIGTDTALLSKSGLEKFNKFVNAYQNDSPDLLGGAGDICLLYHSQSFDYTSDMLLPYTAYIDSNGKIKDTMFDGFLFLLSGTFPSGNAGYQASVKSDWEWSLNQLFANGKNLKALDEAAGKTQSALGSDDKYTFYLTVYYPHYEASAFGDVDGDGKNESMSKLSERLKVVEWYINLCYEKIAEANLRNLEFGGFYWYHEAVESSDPNPDIIKGISELVHEHDTQFFWIPYFCSNGYTDWADNGFDVACMQPNYVFKQDAPLTNIKNAATLIKLYGMCIEIEISGQSLTSDNFMQRYFEYLKGGTYYGYMDSAMHMYYQDMLCYGNAATSSDPKARLIYDYTYQFIKHTLDIYPEKAKNITIDAVKDSVLEGSVKATDSSIAGYTLTLSPAHGTVTINADGSYCYYPDAGYTGTDRFEYAYNEGLDYSPSCVVEIKVK